MIMIADGNGDFTLKAVGLENGRLQVRPRLALATIP